MDMNIDFDKMIQQKSHFWKACEDNLALPAARVVGLATAPAAWACPARVTTIFKIQLVAADI